jgi:hypothetical protein
MSISFNFICSFKLTKLYNITFIIIIIFFLDLSFLDFGLLGLFLFLFDAIRINIKV